jgi:hypothetical protein
MPSHAAATMIKMSVVLDSNGRVAGAFKPSDYRPAKEGDEKVVTGGVIAAPGQSVVEVEVPAEVASLDTPELLSRLAEQSSVQAAIANTPTGGQASWSSSQAFTALPPGESQQGLTGVSGGQASGPFTQSFRSLEIGAAGVVIGGSVV